MLRFVAWRKNGHGTDSSRLDHQQFLNFYRATRMHSADYAVAGRLSVCHTQVMVFCLNAYTLYPQTFFHHQVALTVYPFLDPGLNEKIFTDTAGSAMMDTPGKNEITSWPMIGHSSNPFVFLGVQNLRQTQIIG